MDKMDDDQKQLSGSPCCPYSPSTSMWIFFDNVRNFVKNLYFILIQICFSQLKYITQHVFFKFKKRFCLRSVDAAWNKVEFCAEYGAGVYLCTRPNRHRRKARDCPRCATAVWTTFTKNGTITFSLMSYCNAFLLFFQPFSIFYC